MSPNKLRMGTAFVVTAAVGVALTLVQHRVIRQLRQENISLHGQVDELADLAQANEALSNQLAQAETVQPTPVDPSQEVLRLRGEVGVLRRQLEELQQLPAAHAPEQSPVADVFLSAEALRRVEDLRNESEFEYIRTKALSDTLREKASDPEALLQGILASGLQDPLLPSWLESRELLAQKLAALMQEPGAQDPRIQVLTNQLAELTTRIDERSQGILLGLSARADSMKLALENLEKDIEAAKENSLPRPPKGF